MTNLHKPPLFIPAGNGRKSTSRLPLGDATWSAARAALIYVVIASVWILASDKLLIALVSDSDDRARIEIFKGWFFVGITGSVLFWHLRAKLLRAQEQEEKLSLFVEYAPVALAMVDREMRYITTSRHWSLHHGLGDQVLRGLFLDETISAASAKWRSAHRRALSGETVGVEADQVVQPDGTVQWLRWEVRPWLDSKGTVAGSVLLSEDITARKLTEEAQLHAQIQMQVALDAGKVGTWNWSLTDGSVECDEATATLFGRTCEEVGRAGPDFFSVNVHPEDRTRIHDDLIAAIRDRHDFVAEYRIVQPDGTTVWLADRGRPQYNSHNHAVRIVGARVDITELKRTQTALHDSERRFREVVETIRDVFWVKDVTSGRITYISPAYEAIWGRPVDDLYNNPRAWTDTIHPEDRERVKLAIERQQLTGEYKETYRVVRPDFTERWVQAHAYPVKDAEGNVIRMVGTAEDVTDRKRLEEQFLRAQRLEAIGTLASGVAHDLNNILAPMFMVAPLLKEKVTDPADIHLLSIIESSAHRGANVVRQLLTFSRGIEGERGPLQVRHLLKEMTAIMQETFPRDITIAHSAPSDLPPVTGDGTQIHQVLMNLCVNARDAMPDGGELALGAKAVILGPDATALHGDARPGRYIIISVRDTGHGIPPEIRNRIFEPFFTTKDLGKGTGLGLSTVLGIVKSHGGFLTVQSEVGHGTCFDVYLPVADLPAETVRVDQAELPANRGETILIVDDERPVLIALQRILEKQGYRVLTAADGREALGIYLLEQARIRAVVTDLMMPEMGGIALARAIRSLTPNLPIIAATGLDSAEKRKALATLSVRTVIPKPYASDDLLLALSRELNPETPSASA